MLSLSVKEVLLSECMCAAAPENSFSSLICALPRLATGVGSSQAQSGGDSFSLIIFSLGTLRSPPSSSPQGPIAPPLSPLSSTSPRPGSSDPWFVRKVVSIMSSPSALFYTPDLITRTFACEKTGQSSSGSSSTASREGNRHFFRKRIFTALGTRL